MEQDHMAGPRPVYVLGAGFSRAIRDDMPLMNELGDDVRARLPGLFPEGQEPRGTFEDWLSLRVTALPFLSGWENSRRAADAEQMISEIASILDERANSASTLTCPSWLLRLVKLWHTERAVVITFNYDTLVERAINEASLTVFGDFGPQVVLADQQVYPAPPAPPAFYYMDSATSTDESLQLLKLHGSLNWYWASGDATGSTLTRLRERSMFGERTLVEEPHDATGVRTLDRFLIPPVSMKNSYYTPHLTNILWRTARKAIRTTKKLTLVGYSMPKTDQIGAELLSGIPESATVEIVDMAPGQASDVNSLAGRVRELNGLEPKCWPGPGCIEEYVEHRFARIPAELGKELCDLGDADVLLSAPLVDGKPNEPHTFILAQDEHGNLTTRDINFSTIARSQMPPREIVLNSLPHGFNKLEDFVRAQVLGHRLLNGQSEAISTGHGDVAPIGVKRIQVGAWNIAAIETAPLRSVRAATEN